MNYQSEEELQRRLQQLEADINSYSPNSTQSQQQQQTNQPQSGQFSSLLGRSQVWFQGLSGMNKLVVSGAAIFVGFLLLQTVFKLIVSVISLAILVGLVYLGYKLFVSKNLPGKQ